MEVVSFLPYTLCAYACAYTNLKSMLKSYKEKVRESMIASFLHITATTTCALRMWRVVAQTERAQQLHDFLMTELLGTHSLFRAVNRRLSDWSVVHSGLNLSPDWLIVRKRWSKPMKTYCKRPYCLHSFLADRDLDSARLETASLSSAPYMQQIPTATQILAWGISKLALLR
jgi:hypothetical protein